MSKDVWQNIDDAPPRIFCSSLCPAFSSLNDTIFSLYLSFSSSSVRLSFTSSSFTHSFTCSRSYFLPLSNHKLFKTCFSILVSAWATARAKQPVAVSCPCLHVVLLSSVLSGIVPVRGGKRVRDRKRHTERGEGQRRKARKQGKACRCRAYLVYKYANTVAFVICK